MKNFVYIRKLIINGRNLGMKRDFIGQKWNDSNTLKEI